MNPTSQSYITKAEMLDLLERLARGSTTDRPTLISQTFADQTIKLLELERCFVDQVKIDMTVLKNKIEHGTFDVHLFN